MMYCCDHLGNDKSRCTDMMCDVPTYIDSMYMKCIYGAANPKLQDKSMCHMCDNYTCKGCWVDYFNNSCAYCNSTCCAVLSRDCSFSCQNCDEHYCTVCWLSDVGRMCPRCNHLSKRNSCILQFDECPKCDHVPMGYDNMDMDEQRVSDPFEQLEREIIEIEAVKRETWKK
jgi:hypothetical protein